MNEAQAMIDVVKHYVAIINTSPVDYRHERTSIGYIKIYTLGIEQLDIDKFPVLEQWAGKDIEIWSELDGVYEYTIVT